MKQRKIVEGILRENPWMLSRILEEQKKKIADDIRTAADENGDLEDLIFELGLERLIQIVRREVHKDKAE